MKLKNFFALGLLLAAGTAFADVAVDLKLNNVTLDTITFVNGQTQTLETVDGVAATLTVTEGATEANFIFGFQKNGETFTIERSVVYGDVLKETCPIHDFTIEVQVAKTDATTAPAVEATTSAPVASTKVSQE